MEKSPVVSPRGGHLNGHRPQLAVVDGGHKPAPNRLAGPSEPRTVAREFVRRMYESDDGLVLRRWRKSWWEWRGSHWQRTEADAIRNRVYDLTEYATYIDGTGVERPWAPNRHRVSNVIDALGGVVLLPDHVEQPTWTDRARGGVYVAAQNGVYDVTEDELLPPTPRYFNQCAVPFDYDPDATEPVAWKKFLGDLFGDDTQQITALQEFFGYVIGGKTDLHKILLIVGPPRAGKGIITRILTALVGAENMSGQTLSGLKGEFGLAPLIGKPLAVIADARLSGEADAVVERLLSVSGEDTLTVNIKYQEQWTGRLPTRFVITSNQLPRLGDASGAIASRFLVLQLTRSWLGKEDTNLEDRLLRELPGILNWSLDGLRRLSQRRRFTVPKSTQDAMADLVKLSSPVKAFLEDECEVDREQGVLVDHLWAAWRRWAKANGEPEGSKSRLGAQLSAAIPGLDKKKLRRGEQRMWEYVGVGLRSH